MLTESMDVRGRTSNRADVVNAQTIRLDPIRDDSRIGSVEIPPALHTIGSATDCDVQFLMDGIAAHHCTIQHDGGRPTIVAISPLTWLNDQPVRKTRLKTGDRLTLGPVTFRVSLVDTVRSVLSDMETSASAKPTESTDNTPDQQLDRIEAVLSSLTSPRSQHGERPQPVTAVVPPMGRPKGSFSNRSPIGRAWERSPLDRAGEHSPANRTGDDSPADRTGEPSPVAPVDAVVPQTDNLLAEAEAAQALRDDLARLEQELQFHQSRREDSIRRTPFAPSPVTAEMESLRRELDQRRRDLEERNESLQRAQSALQKERDRLDTQRQQTADALQAMEASRAEIEQQRLTVAEAVEQARTEREEWRVEREEQRRQLLELQQRVEQQFESVREAETELAEREHTLVQRIAACDERTAELDARAESLRQWSAELDERQSALEQSAEQQQARQVELEESLAQVEAARSELAARKAEWQSDRVRLDREIEQHTEHQAAHENTVRELTSRQEELSLRESTVQQQIESLAAQAEELEHRRIAWEAAQANRLSIQTTDEESGQSGSEQLAGDRDRIEAERRELEAETEHLRSLRTEIHGEQARLEDIQQHIDNQRRELDAARQAAEVRHQQMEELRHELALERRQLESRLEQLATERLSHAETSSWEEESPSIASLEIPQEVTHDDAEARLPDEPTGHSTPVVDDAGGEEQEPVAQPLAEVEAIALEPEARDLGSENTETSAPEASDAVEVPTIETATIEAATIEAAAIEAAATEVPTEAETEIEAAAAVEPQPAARATAQIMPATYLAFLEELHAGAQSVAANTAADAEAETAGQEAEVSNESIDAVAPVASAVLSSLDVERSSDVSTRVESPAEGEDEASSGDLRSTLAAMFGISQDKLNEAAGREHGETDATPQSDRPTDIGTIESHEADPDSSAETVYESSETADSGEDSIATYMQQLLARSNRESSTASAVWPTSPAQTAKTSTVPGEPESLTAVETPVDSEPRSQPVPVAIPAPVPVSPVRKKPTKVDKQEQRNSLDSMRQLANLSARSAVAQHHSRKLGLSFQVKLTLTLLSAFVTTWLLTAPLWGPNSYQIQGIGTLLVTLFLAFQLIRTVQTLNQVNRRAASSESHFQNESGESAD